RKAGEGPGQAARSSRSQAAQRASSAPSWTRVTRGRSVAGGLAWPMGSPLRSPRTGAGELSGEADPGWRRGAGRRRGGAEKQGSARGLSEAFRFEGDAVAHGDAEFV